MFSFFGKKISHVWINSRFCLQFQMIQWALQPVKPFGGDIGR